MKTYNPDDCIAALATPWAQSALAVIRTSGPGCIEKISPLFSRPEMLKKSNGGTIHFGTLGFSGGGGKVDEITAAVFRAPKSYTGQDSVELFVHGSLPGIRRILDLLLSSGFRQAQPGEFTMRAFLNGKIDLTRAEAVNEIVTAKSIKAQDLALQRLSGRIESRVNEIKMHLVKLLASVEVQLDYPEEDAESAALPLPELTFIREKVASLCESFKEGRIFQEGVRVVLAGRTNAGKSSLFNLFLREDRSIVSEIHGTTRDYIESWISVEGIPVRLFDTAGLRRADDPVESEGVRRTEEVLKGADFIIYLVDGAAGISEDDSTFLRKGDARILPVWSKVDLDRGGAPDGFTALSTVDGTGFHELEKELVKRILGSEHVRSGEPVIDSLRQHDLLVRCRDSIDLAVRGTEQEMPLDLIAQDLQDAVHALGEITGEITTADILETMFSDFCVGK